MDFRHSENPEPFSQIIRHYDSTLMNRVAIAEVSKIMGELTAFCQQVKEHALTTEVTVGDIYKDIDAIIDELKKLKRVIIHSSQEELCM